MVDEQSKILVKPTECVIFSAKAKEMIMFLK